MKGHHLMINLFGPILPIPDDGFRQRPHSDPPVHNQSTVEPCSMLIRLLGKEMDVLMRSNAL